jgi:hypothetical protein
VTIASLTDLDLTHSFLGYGGAVVSDNTICHKLLTRSDDCSHIPCR